MKTKLDLYNSAHAAAVLSLGLDSGLAVDTARVDSFKAAGHDATDYDLWRKLFEELREKMLVLGRESTKAQQAAMKA